MAKYLNLAAVRLCTESEGPGKRFALWVQGCKQRCPDCCNQKMQEFTQAHVVELSDFTKLIEKAKKNQLTNAEFLILKDFDLAELKGYEQAKELTITLLQDWLVQYKFKDWNKHKDGRDVTLEEKTQRAENKKTYPGDGDRHGTCRTLCTCVHSFYGKDKYTEQDHTG